jgi:hypothetical protein
MQKNDQDEILDVCVQCSHTGLRAYWDFELESYLFMVDNDEPFTCISCRSEFKLHDNQLELSNL